MLYEAVIVWETGDKEKEVHCYNTREEAENAVEGYKMAFGQQVRWAGVRESAGIDQWKDLSGAEWY